MVRTLTLGSAVVLLCSPLLLQVVFTRFTRHPLQPASLAQAEITYAKHIAPILQRSCENCHRTDGVAPMALSTYDEVRPWARAIKQRTGMGPRAGVMPPWARREEHRHPALQERPVALGDEIAMIACGRMAAHRAAIPPTCPAAGLERCHEVVDRRTGSRGAHRGDRGEGGCAGLVGRFRASPPASPKIATSRRSRSGK